MSTDSTSVGRRIADFQYSPPCEAYTGVAVTSTTGNNATFTAGTNTGRVMEVSCMWANQDVADNILSKISGYAYKPFSAGEAFLDPAAELGDGLNVNGIYTVLGDIVFTYDALGTADIAAPGAGELTSEYPYLPPIARKVQQVKNIADSAFDTAATALTTAENAEDAAEAVETIVTGWTYTGTTYIDGEMIKAGTVMASSLQGGTVQLLTSNEAVAGDISITGASSATYAISLSSNGALSLSAGGGGSAQLSGGGAYILLQGDEVRFSDDIRPNANGGADCGTQNYKWDDVWANNATIQTSDAQAKEDISYDISAYNDFIAKLKPVTYKFVDGHRTHIGFIAQDIETALAECGISTEDFAGFIKAPRHDGGYDYALRYGEFIALQQYQIQKLEARIKALEEALNNG